MARAKKASRFREMRMPGRSLDRNSGAVGQAVRFPIASRTGSRLHVVLHEALHNLTSLKCHARGTSFQMKKSRLKSG